MVPVTSAGERWTWSTRALDLLGLAETAGGPARLDALADVTGRAARAEAAVVEAVLRHAEGAFGDAARTANDAVGLARGELAATPGSTSEALVLLAVDQALRSTLRAAGSAAALQLADDTGRWAGALPDVIHLLDVRRAAALEQAPDLDLAGIEDDAVLAEAATHRLVALEPEDDVVVAAIDATVALEAKWNPWDRRVEVECWLRLARALYAGGATSLLVGELGGSLGGDARARVIDVALDRARDRARGAWEQADVLLAVLTCGGVLDPTDHEVFPVALSDLGAESLAEIEPLVETRQVRDPDVAAGLLREAARRESPRRRLAPFRRAAEISRGVGDLDAFADDALAAAAGQHGLSPEDAAATLEHSLRVLDVHDALDRRRAAEVATARLLADGTGPRAVFSVSRADNTTVLGGHRAGPAGMVRFDLGNDLTVEVDALDLSVLGIAERGSPRVLPLLARSDLGDAPLLAVPVDDDLLRWFGRLGAILLAFEAGVGGHPLARAALLLQWAATCRTEVAGQRFIDDDECDAFHADARAAFAALPPRSREVLNGLRADEQSLVRACEVALFGGQVTPAAREEAAQLALALRTIGEEAPELRTLDEELAELLEASVALRAFAGTSSGPTEQGELGRVSRREAIAVTRLAAVEARRGGDADWPAVEEVWQARRPGVQRALIDELTMVHGWLSPAGVENGIGWPYWRALLAHQRRPLLPPLRTWDARWETLALGSVSG